MKAMFEEATRCPDCQSDQIYVMQDTDGGICVVCKAILTGPVKGGISYAEYARIKGILKADPETINDLDRKAEAAEKAKEDVAKLKADMERLNKSAVMPIRVATPIRTMEAPKVPKIVMPSPKDWPLKPKEEPKKEKGPSIFKKAKDWLMTQVERKPEPEPVTPTKEVGLPKIGEQWSIGPCKHCSLDKKYVGRVRNSKASKTCERFLVLENGYYGCFFCAKKS